MQILRNDKLNADYKDQIRLDLWCSSKYADQTNMKTQLQFSLQETSSNLKRISKHLTSIESPQQNQSSSLQCK
jgi:hypothetical protein